MAQQIIFTNTPGKDLDDALGAINPDAKVFALVDSNTRSLVWPRISSESERLRSAHVINIPAGDTHKNLESLTAVWRALVEQQASRKSILVNVGGGMVTDLGGFAAATFKRGIPFVNVPTTLLAAVDAAVGGKTGINFMGLKNEIGAFREAHTVIISTRYLSTLPESELLSGYGEMLKHGLLNSESQFLRLLGYDIASEEAFDDRTLLNLLEESVEVKRRVVLEDPTEKGLRKALNLGHTPAHAFESWAMARRQPIPHGYAVAWGLVVDLILSNMRLSFPSPLLQRLATYVKEQYGVLPITCDDYPALIGYMLHDKKNDGGGSINFTLLDAPGKVHLDSLVPEEEIRQALDIFRDLIQ